MAASSKPAMVQLLDDEDDDNDLEFLSHIEAIEAQALSLSSSKRRRITLESSPAPPPPPPPPPPILTTSATVKVQSERGAVPVQEGAYTAALRGSKSLTWQNHSHSHSQAPPVPSTRATASGGSGACFKCGKEGHWARDCDVSNTLGVVENDKACPCGLGTCLLLTANTDRNRGRKFFRCPLRQENGGCGFFEWCDDSSGFRSSTEDRAWKNGVQEQFYQHPATQGTSGISKPWNEYDKGSNSLNSSYGSVHQKFETTDSKSYSMRSGSSCFKCGEEGHWARDCSAPSSNATSAGVGRKTSSSDTCYKCGGSGHWAKDCTQGQGQGQSMKLRNW